MSAQILVHYTTPADQEAFERHYAEVHMPLVLAIPGVRAEAGRVRTALDGGEQTLYRTAVLTFDDMTALEAGMASQQGQDTAADYASIAPEGSRMFLQATD